jgi:glycosyltransferase involved in cell wall biosynthesis
MNIAVTANSAWNLLNFRLSLLQTLAREGHQVFAIAPLDEAVEQITLQSKAKFIPLKMLSRKGSNPYQDIKLIREYRKIYKENQIDIAIQYTIKPNIYGSLAGARVGTKTISNLTGLGYVFLNKSLKNTIAKKLYKVSLRKTSFACFHNATDAQLFNELGLVSKAKIKVINGSGVDTQFYQAFERPQNEKFVFLFIGRLLVDKGIRELLEAYQKLFQHNKNIELQILGDIDIGNPASLTGEDIENYKKKTNLVHHGMQAEVKDFINSSDCVVLPSYREGLPKSLLESMSMSTPIITVNSVGCEHLIDNEKNGFLAELKSSESLFQKMKQMSELSVGKRNDMGIQGRKLVLENYSSEIINNEYIKLISQLSE